MAASYDIELATQESQPPFMVHKRSSTAIFDGHLPRHALASILATFAWQPAILKQSYEKELRSTCRPYSTPRVCRNALEPLRSSRESPSLSASVAGLA